LGANSDNSIEVDKRNLWSGICYDSPNPEGEISKIKPGDEILVFGKIPQRAIRIPLFTGGTTSPDFIYAIRRDDGNTEINLFIEAKSNDLRESEQIAISSQESFFKKSSVWRKVTSAKEVENLLNEL
jgi:type III restriction enzyme